MLKKHLLRDSKGMTLIELLGVLVIIGILFVVLNAAINSATDRAKVAGAQTDLRSMQTGVEYFKKLNSQLPLPTQLNKHSDIQFGTWTQAAKDGGYKDTTGFTAENPQTPVDPSAPNTFLARSDKLDPWGRPYGMIYENGSNLLYLVSSGPDGKLESDPLTTPGDDIVVVFYNNTGKDYDFIFNGSVVTP